MLVVFGLILVNCLSVVVGRGPHHPRGEAVVKHHVHYRPTRNVEQKLTEDVELLHDTAHIQEHLEEEVEQLPDLSKMSEEELEFYYFNSHDTDKNAKLDGLEILQAILHTSHHDKHDNEKGESDVQEEEDDTSFYIEQIDRVLEEDDTDNDGYLSYAEYTASRRKHAQSNEPAVQTNEPVVRMVP